MQDGRWESGELCDLGFLLSAAGTSTQPPPQVPMGTTHRDGAIPNSERANTRIYSSPPRPKHDLAKPLGLNNYVLLDRIWVLPLAEVMFLQQAIMKICVCFSQLPYCWQMIKTHDISTDCHVFLSLYMTKRAEMSCISLPAHNHKRSKKNLF